MTESICIERHTSGGCQIREEEMPTDLRPLRVAQATSQLLKAKHLKRQPAWLPVVSRTPPSTDLARKKLPTFDLPTTKSTTSTDHDNGTATQRRRKTQSRARLFSPREIRYVEDSLRERFFRDFPWELARPVKVMEDDGADFVKYDWSRLVQRGRPLNGESVVQHQLWLMTRHTPPYDREQAYSIAIKQFKRLRMEEAVERKIAVEEALTFGARFNKTELHVGLELENKVLEGWREKVVAARALTSPGASPISSSQGRDEEEDETTP